MKNSKNILGKFLAIITMAILMLNSSTLIAISTAIDAIKNQIDASKVTATMDMKIEKYVNYNIDENNKGALIQLGLKTGIEYQENLEYQAIKNTDIIINSPKICDEYPEKVNIIVKSTKATNGSETGKDVKYEYNQENGQIQIIINNKADENGNIYTENVEGAQDELSIIYYYSSNCYTENKDTREIEIKGTISETVDDGADTIVNGNAYGKGELNEDIGGLISTSEITENLYNGYIKANKENGTNYDTEYSENMNINISYQNISDGVIINREDTFTQNENVIETNQIIYKSTRINKQTILDILGENGKLQILSGDGNVILEVNKDTQTNEQGIVEINYPEETNKIIIRTTKPNTVGIIKLENTKVIKSTMQNLDYNNIKIEDNIKCINTIEQKDENTRETNIVNQEIYGFSNTNNEEIKNAETKIDVSIDKNELTNLSQNAVIITATLVSNSSQYNLFKNPVIEIEMPNEVEKVVLGDVYSLYGNNLNIKNSEVIERDGNKVIRIELEGTQTEYYLNSIVDGTNIVIPATIIIRKDVETTDSNLKVTYANEFGDNIDYEAEGKESKDIGVKIECPIITSSKQNTAMGQTLTNTASAATLKEQNAITVEVTPQIGADTITSGASVHEKEVIKYNVKITNNTQEKIEGIKIQGQVPEGTNYATIDIGTYYEENYEYIEDSSKRTFDYEITSLDANETATGFYEVVVQSLSSGETEKDIQNDITLTVNDETYDTYSINNKIVKANMQVELKSYLGRDTLNSFYYELRVSNLSDQELTDINIATSEFQKEMSYDINDFSWDMYNIGDTSSSNEDEQTSPIENEKYENNILSAVITSIPVGKTVEIAFNLVAENFDDKTNETELKLSATAQGGDNDIYRSNENRRSSYPQYVNVAMSSDKEGESVNYDDEINYTVTIKNESLVRTEVDIRDFLPEQLQGVSGTYNRFNITEDSGTSEVTDNGETSSETENVERDPSLSEDYEYDEDYGESETGNNGTSGETNSEDEVEETVEETEENPENIYDVEAEQNLEFTEETMSINFKLEKEEDEANINLHETIPAGQTITLNFKVRVGDVETNTEISNYITVSGTYIKTTTSNIIKNTVLAETITPDDDGDDDPENPTNPSTNPSDPSNPGNTTSKYSVSGIAWLDSNKDGERSSGEELLQGITVKLFNATTNAIAVDTSGNAQKTTTDFNGKYEFSNTLTGNYWVLFEYDTSTYGITTYNKSGVSSGVNSDAIKTEVNIDGVVKTVGLTDTITVNANRTNIDIGLTKNGTFDFSISKYLTSVAATNGSGTKEYTYNDKQLAKIEINRKQLANTTISVKYKIVVKNEGETDGYINEIVDNIPSTMQFNSSGNSGWSSNGGTSVKYTALAGQKIEAGASKEINLTLTRAYSENDSMGTLQNVAKLTSISNSDDIQESNTGNNSSEADLIVSINTGLARNITIVLVCVALGIVFAYLMKTKKIKQFIILAFILIIGGLTVVSVAASVDIHIAGGHGPHSWIFRDRNNGGKRYYCMDSGYPMCTAGHHYYKWYKTKVISTKTTTKYNDTKKGELEISKNSDSGVTEVTSGVYGPYIITSNYTGSVTIKVTTDKVTATIDSEGETSNEKITVVDKNGKALSGKSATKIEKDDSYLYTFYLKFDSSIGTIKNVTATLKTGNISKTTTTTKKKLMYSCYKISGTHGSSCKAAKDGTCKTSSGKKACQRMFRYVTTTTTTNNKESDSVAWGKDVNVNANDGKLTIIKKDESTGERINGAVIKVTGKDANGKTITLPASFKELVFAEESDTQSSESDGQITKSNGKIVLSKLPYGTYTITETTAPKGYDLSLQTTTKWTATVSAEKKKVTINMENTQYGNVDIIKTDADTGKQLSNEKNTVTVKIFTLKTADELEELKEKYTVSDNENNRTIIQVEENTSEETEEEQTENTTTTTYIKMADYVAIYIKSYEYIENKASKITYTTNEEEAMSFTTNTTGDNIGKIILRNIPVGTYYAQETAINFSETVDRPTGTSELQEFYECKTYTKNEEGKYNINEFYQLNVTSSKDSDNNEVDTQIWKIENEQAYADITGYVWEDKESSKDSTRNDLYKDSEGDAEDVLAEGITVRLMQETNDGKGNTESIVFNEFVTTTDKNGQYVFEKVPLEHLRKISSNSEEDNGNSEESYDENTNDTTENESTEVETTYRYYIEFEYNGLKYQDVEPKNVSNGSKASETESDRKTLNTQFANITGNTTKNSNGNTGYSNNDNQNTNVLTYTRPEAYKSQLVQNTGYTVESAKNSVNGSGVKMVASTLNVNEEGISWEPDSESSTIQTTIKDINLGIYEREQPDMAITSDIKSVTLSINGEEQTYPYGEKGNLPEEDKYSVGVKFQNTKAMHTDDDNAYKSTIYRSYALASAIEEGNEGYIKNKLELWSTYKITIRNESSSLSMSANSIIDYVDPKYESVESSTYEYSGTSGNLDWKAEGTVNGYTKITTTSLNGVKILPSNSLTITLILKMKTSGIIELAKDSNVESTDLNNVVEIGGYSTYDKYGNHYAGIDVDSAPANAQPGTIDTYEDDTDISPILKLVFQDGQNMNGTVFEDTTTLDENTNERNGDGKLDGDPNRIQNVEVKLVDSEGNQVYQYTIAETTGANVKTETNGTYAFSGLIPGNYRLQFTYGDGDNKTYIYKDTEQLGEVTTEKYKSTIITNNTIKEAIGNEENNLTWYQSAGNYSTAVDDYSKREEINDSIKEVDNSVKTNYKSTPITASTPKMKLEIATDTVTLNFGIAERPHVDVEVTKTIKYAKLALANGQSIAEGTPAPTSTIQDLKNGSIRIELDSSLIQGSTLSLKYSLSIKNNSETDYATKDYYYYGTKSNETNTTQINITSIVDYLDEKLVVGELGTGWNAIDSINKIKVMDSVKRNNGNRKNILVYNSDISVTKGATVSLNDFLTASKLLNNSEDSTYTNHVEVLSYKTNVGRFLTSSTPGNYDPSTETPSESDNSNIKMIVIPSTGENKTYYYIILGIGCMAILGTGIYLIKRKVL